MHAASSQVHRFGQRDAVRIYRLTVRHTVEQKLLALQARKQDIADSALRDYRPDDATSSAGKGLTLEELTDFFK